MKKAFTMLELVFVIVIIGILSAIAIPKFAATRDDAIITRGMSTLAAVRNAIATERQKRVLRGDFTSIGDLGASGGRIFTGFDNNASNPVLEYDMKSGTTNGLWSQTDATTYVFHYFGGSTCTFTLANNRLTGTCPVFGD